MVMLYIIFLQSEPNQVYFRKRWFVVIQEQMFLKLSKFFDYTACTLADTITYWSKGRVKHNYKTLKKRSLKNRRQFKKLKFGIKFNNRQKCQWKQRSPSKTTTLYTFPTQVVKSKPREIYFDNAKVQAGIDNRCTASISNDPRDFVGKLTPVRVNLISYTGEDQVEMMKGTLLWKWKDDEGHLHSFKIPNSYYDPKGSRFLSPQHWASELKKSGAYEQNSIFYKGDVTSIALCWYKYTTTCKYMKERVGNTTLHMEEAKVNTNE